MSDEKKSRVRVFCAVELPAGVRAETADYIEQLRGMFPRMKVGWDRAEKLHLTLKFLGEIEAERVESLSHAAARAVGGVPAFQINIEGTGAFPPRGIPRVLWLGVRDESGGLVQLREGLERECAAAGFPREERPFHPHLTVARLRSPEGARALAAEHARAQFKSEAFKVRALVVMRSELGPGGSRYTVLSSFSLLH